MTEQGADRGAEYAGLVLPEGARLVHIGPHKTGTTSLQAALFNAREGMLAQGVRHVGRSRNPASAVRAVTNQPAPTSHDTPPPIRHWQDLVTEFRKAPEPRVVVSSEFFSWATPEVIGRIADDLDRSRMHVVVTLRPLGKILPSQWQQNVQAGMMLTFDEWLHEIFGDTPGRAASPFWQLHRHDALIRRWAEVLGTDRVTAVVVDEKDHGMLLRVFEGFLGLRTGTMAVDRDLSNRSMTVEEVEAVRAFNHAAKRAGVTRAIHAKTMRFGSAMHMKLREPGPAEPKIETPRWALDRAAEVAAEMVPQISATGVRIIGNIGALTAPIANKVEGDQFADVRIPPEVAAEMALGILISSGLAREHTPGSPVEPMEVARVPTRTLAAVVVRRSRSAAARAVKRVVRPGRG